MDNNIYGKYHIDFVQQINRPWTRSFTKKYTVFNDKNKIYIPNKNIKNYILNKIDFSKPIYHKKYNKLSSYQKNQINKKKNKLYIVQKYEHQIYLPNVYKIGHTNNPILSRINNYNKGLELIETRDLGDIDSLKIEKILKKTFKKLFIKRFDLGDEYFEGDISHMKKQFNEIINNALKL